jgi:hypothetical protein
MRALVPAFPATRAGCTSTRKLEKYGFEKVLEFRGA